MAAPSPTAAPPSRAVASPEPEVRRHAVVVARFLGALLFVWLAVWWVVPPHAFSGPVIWVFDGKDGHGLHLGDLPAALWIVAAVWLVWPTGRGRHPHRATLDALRVAAVGGLGALSLYWIVPEHSWSGPTILDLGRRHGMHVLDPVVVLFLGAAVAIGWRWWQPVAAGLLATLAVWWAKGSHASFSGPVIARWHGHVLQRSDPIALVYLAAAGVIGVPWLRQRWERFQRERRESRLATVRPATD
jgi:hypothetical protein